MIRRNITKTNLKSHPDKYLKDHLLEVGRESEKIINSKKLSLTLISKDILQKVSYLIGISHDFGKVTSYFQNKISKGMNSSLSHHGLISALFGYFIVNSYIDNKEISMISYIVIKKHHGNLESPLNCIELKNDLKAQIDDIEERLDDVIELYSLLLEDNFNINIYNLLKNIKEMIYNNCDDFTEDNFENIVLKDVDNEYGIERFLLTNFLYSVLIDCDKLSAANIKTRYFDGNLKSKISVENYLDKLKIENPEEFDENEEINRIRNEFFYEVINNVNIKKENFLYKLTAPTGIGKTFASFAFANKLKSLFEEGSRIIYCLPYTSIIDQSHAIIEEILNYNIGEEFKKKQTKYLLKHHHLTPLKLLEDIENKIDSEDYLTFFDKKLLLESWESGNIVTTFIQLFQSIISDKNSFLLKFHNIVNSIIILDEIQTLPVKYYKLIGEIFTVLSEKFKTYILFSSATQPKIILEKNKVINLVDEFKYSKHKEFDRVDLKILNKLNPISIDDFILKFINEFIYESGLIICNKIKIALILYEKLKNNFKKKGYKVYSLTTHIIPLERKRIIDEVKENLKNKEKILVISTQLVEAGIDFSFEVVYRDLAPIDSIVQAAGRSNRHNELKKKNKKGKLFLYNITDEKGMEGNSIYDSKLIQDTKEYLKNDFYSSSDFINLSTKYFLNINKENESDKLLNGIKKLNYNIEKKSNEIPIKDFRLIENDCRKVDVILSFNEEIDRKIQRLIELHEFIKSNKKEMYSFEKEFEELEDLKKELNNYTISINESKITFYLKEFNNIKYISYCDLDKVYDKDIGFKEDIETPSSICF